MVGGEGLRIEGLVPVEHVAMVLAMFKLTMVKLNMAKSACYAHSADHLDQSLFTAA